MDMNIAGRGTVFPGSYNNVKVSGRAAANGHFKCQELNVSGKFEGKSADCEAMIRISGSAYFEESIKVGGADISGSLKCDKDVEITGDTKVMGSLSCAGLKAGDMVIRGSLKCEKDIEAKKISVNGFIYCDGAVVADELDMNFETGAKLGIGSISCKKVRIVPEYIPKNIENRLDAGFVTVDTIKGEDIYLENVIANIVEGKNVTIGEGCKIGKVEIV